jgi:multicomponent Na+:H+ antiporter subunit D
MMKAALFLVAGNLHYKLGHSDITRFDDSYRIRFPWTMAAFTVAALSMVGLPPLAGFFSKWYLALGAIENQSWVFLAVILVSSLLNAVYFFRILERVYLRRPAAVLSTGGMVEVNDKPDIKRDEVPFSLIMPVIVLALGLLAAGLFNSYIVDILMSAYPGN